MRSAAKQLKKSLSNTILDAALDQHDANQGDPFAEGMVVHAPIDFPSPKENKI